VAVSFIGGGIVNFKWQKQRT